MADEPKIPENEAYTKQLQEATQATDQFSVGTKFAGEAVGFLAGGLAKAGNVLEGLSSGLKNNAGAFNALSTGMLGANTEFQKFNEGIDTGRLNTFTKQFDGLFGILAKSPGIGFSKDMLSTFASLGASGDKLKELAGATGAAAAKMGRAFMTNADNILYAQNAMYQMSASTGELHTLMTGIPGVLAAAGDGLENINKAGADYTTMIGNVSEATHQQYGETIKWAEKLGTLPGGLAAVMSPLTIANQQTNALTAAMQLATGAGMSQSMTMDLMTDAMKRYGAGTEGALKYAARAGEITESIKGAKISDVAAALGATSEKFKDYVYGAADATAMTQNLANANEAYAKNLQAGGVPAQEAIEMASKMTGKMHDLTVAQRAYLSQQTGGPGGLLGSLQMEKMIRDHPDEAMAKMQEAMQKRMGGNIVTLDTARTEADAAKLQQEKQMLMHGPMKMADSEGEANAILTAMHAKRGALNKAEIEEAKKRFSAEEAIKRGATVEDQTATRFGQMQIAAENMQVAAGQVTLNGMQGAFTEKMGMQGGVGGTNAGVSNDKDQIAQVRRGANVRSTHQSDAVQSAISDFTNQLRGHFPALIDNVKSLMENFGTGNQAQASTAAKALDQGAATTRAQIAKIPEDDVRQKKLAQFDSVMSNLHKTIEGGVERYASAGKQVGGVIPTKHTTDPASKTTGSLAHPVSSEPIPVRLVGSGLTVNFTGKCPHCNAPINTTASASSVSQTANTRAPSGA
jgi:hypothetical protein